MDPPKSGTLHVPIIWNQNSVAISLQTLHCTTFQYFLPVMQEANLMVFIK